MRSFFVAILHVPPRQNIVCVRRLRCLKKFDTECESDASGLRWSLVHGVEMHWPARYQPHIGVVGRATPGAAATVAVAVPAAVAGTADIFNTNACFLF